jgi:cyclopropane fatty-acyl-phospholipid synthase-like methyltransferase
MTGSHWLRIWNDWPTRFASTDYLRQVAKTVEGQPISERQCEQLVATIVDRLDLEPSDVLLDLCCGNGLITARLAACCRQVVGVDFSAPLLAVAERDHQPTNVMYRQQSALDLGQVTALGTFDKVLMYDALQFFTRPQLEGLLRGVLRLAAPDCRILFGGVPYRPHRRRHYDTPPKVLRAWWYRMTGRDLMGTWWEEKDFLAACQATDLAYECFNQPPDLYNARFRFDVVVSRTLRRSVPVGGAFE